MQYAADLVSSRRPCAVRKRVTTVAHDGGAGHLLHVERKCHQLYLLS
jgi:hypothetical protein